MGADFIKASQPKKIKAKYSLYNWTKNIQQQDRYI